MRRSDWRLKPKIHCGRDTDWLVLIPTVIYYPWKFRYPGFPAIALHWMGFYIEFGNWEHKEDAT